MSSISAHPPKDWPFTEQFFSRFKKRGDKSQYILDLIARDLSGEISPPNAMSPTILVDLARSLCGPLVAEDMEKAATNVDQRRELSGLLLNYIRSRLGGDGGLYMVAEDPKPRAPHGGSRITGDPAVRDPEKHDASKKRGRREA